MWRKNVSITEYSSETSHKSRHHCIWKASFALTYTLIEEQTCSSPSMSAVLQNTRRPWISVSCSIAPGTQFGSIFFAIKFLCFVWTTQALAARHFPVRRFVSSFLSFVNFYKSCFTHSMFFCSSHIKGLNWYLLHCKLYMRSRCKSLGMWKVIFVYPRCVMLVSPDTL